MICLIKLPQSFSNWICESPSTWLLTSEVPVKSSCWLSCFHTLPYFTYDSFLSDLNDVRPFPLKYTLFNKLGILSITAYSNTSLPNGVTKFIYLQIPSSIFKFRGKLYNTIQLRLPRFAKWYLPESMLVAIRNDVACKSYHSYALDCERVVLQNTHIVCGLCFSSSGAFLNYQFPPQNPIMLVAHFERTKLRGNNDWARSVRPWFLVIRHRRHFLFISPSGRRTVCVWWCIILQSRNANGFFSE